MVCKRHQIVKRFGIVGNVRVRQLKVFIVLYVTLSMLAPAVSAFSANGDTKQFPFDAPPAGYQLTKAEEASCVSPCSMDAICPSSIGCIHCAVIPTATSPNNPVPESLSPQYATTAFTSPIVPGVYRPPPTPRPLADLALALKRSCAAG